MRLRSHWPGWNWSCSRSPTGRTRTAQREIASRDLSNGAAKRQSTNQLPAIQFEVCHESEHVFSMTIRTRATHAVLYDGDCPFCVFQMRLITWLDWFNTVSLLPISNPRAAELAPKVRREDLLEAIH